ncbi:hypothetical protein K440DRAFT_641737 [Wilcoxina mikolae CBS 423.85]|nr:hypothetical protein K440DRAFT_641737 [Wilcoxina mikolae CBS 423.85]
MTRPFISTCGLVQASKALVLLIEEEKEVVQVEKEVFVGSGVEKEAIYSMPGKQDPEKEAIYPTPIAAPRASGLRGYWETFMAWKYHWHFTTGVFVSIITITIIAVVTGAKRKHDDNLASSKQIHLTGIRPDSGIATLSLGNSTTDSYQLRVYFQSHDNHIQEQIYDGTKWLDKPLSLVEGKSGTPITAMFYPYDYDKGPVWTSPEFTISVCFLNKDNDLVEHVNNGTSWKAGSLGQAEKFEAVNDSQLRGTLLRKKPKPGLFRPVYNCPSVSSAHFSDINAEAIQCYNNDSKTVFFYERGFNGDENWNSPKVLMLGEGGQGPVPANSTPFFGFIPRNQSNIVQLTILGSHTNHNKELEELQTFLFDLAVEANAEGDEMKKRKAKRDLVTLAGLR